MKPTDMRYAFGNHSVSQYENIKKLFETGKMSLRNNADLLAEWNIEIKDWSEPIPFTLFSWALMNILGTLKYQANGLSTSSKIINYKEIKSMLFNLSSNDIYNNRTLYKKIKDELKRLSFIEITITRVSKVDENSSVDDLSDDRKMKSYLFTDSEVNTETFSFFDIEFNDRQIKLKSNPILYKISAITDCFAFVPETSLLMNDEWVKENNKHRTLEDYLIQLYIYSQFSAKGGRTNKTYIEDDKYYVYLVVNDLLKMVNRPLTIGNRKHLDELVNEIVNYECSKENVRDIITDYDRTDDYFATHKSLKDITGNPIQRIIVMVNGCYDFDFDKKDEIQKPFLPTTMDSVSEVKQGVGVAPHTILEFSYII